MNEPVGVFLWRRLDCPGHDACRLFKLVNGWLLAGAAIFWADGRPCHLAYEVATDAAWRTQHASVSGYLGRKAVEIDITSSNGTRWQINGTEKARVAGCVDVDLGFTPATNMIAIRRLALKIGQRSEAPAAWLRFPDFRLMKLPQSYVRSGRNTYHYESPTVGYAGTLHVLPSGAVKQYPGLWEQVHPVGTEA